ncbi:hypothetical protein BU23DRAFT_563578 [Bimuria novae-zelandiae CBS 107.79]|uniref:Uncharacterized protein n=1 Tax=Bimuria novae-zelandiae CBS 107.79 TaxID=1447943 RepID=A0A6A5VNU7_9PLEO|nr:hypothetical protein BU23DRAFT_563578 [Bimuria novae-zelandiae CBS 107.79]
MPTSSSNSGTNRSDPGRVGNNTQTNGNGEAAIRNEQRSTSTNAAESTPPAVYANDLEDNPDNAGTRSLNHLRYFYDEPSANMAEFWTFSTDGFDPFYTDSSATPQAAAAENPAVSLSDLLPEEDPAIQEQPQNAWATAICEHASHPRRHLNTPLLAGDGAENGNAPSLDDLPVHVSNLRLGTPTEERLAVLAQFSDYPEDDASNAALGEDSTASSQRDATTLTRRRNRGAARRGMLTRTTSEANQAFWHQFSGSENDREST